MRSTLPPAPRPPMTRAAAIKRLEPIRGVREHRAQRTPLGLARFGKLSSAC
jgi:hypothetical protein